MKQLIISALLLSSLAFSGLAQEVRSASNPSCSTNCDLLRVSYFYSNDHSSIVRLSFIGPYSSGSFYLNKDMALLAYDGSRRIGTYSARGCYFIDSNGDVTIMGFNKSFRYQPGKSYSDILIEFDPIPSYATSVSIIEPAVNTSDIPWHWNDIAMVYRSGYSGSSSSSSSGYSSGYASGSSSSQSSSSGDYSKEIGLGILLGLAAIAVDALTDKGSSSSSSSSSSYSSSSSSTGSLKGHSWVDLGLPSGTKWATCNVGASSSSQYGNYYAWGEVWTKSLDDYRENNYVYYKNVTETSATITKYNSKDNRTVIYDTSDDAAGANWASDGSWQTPSRAQFQELLDHCDWTWTSTNGTNGYKVKSRKNGNSIFLPAGGYKEEGYYPTQFSGTYMTRERNASNAFHIYVLYFDSSKKYVDNDWDRYYGYMVRPVVNSH